MATGAEIAAASAVASAFSSVGSFVFGRKDKNTTPASRLEFALKLFEIGKGGFVFGNTRQRALAEIAARKNPTVKKPVIPAPVPSRFTAGQLPPGTRGFGSPSFPEIEGFLFPALRLFRLLRQGLKIGEIIRRRQPKQPKKQPTAKPKRTQPGRDPRFKRDRPFERPKPERPTRPKPPEIQPARIPPRPAAIPGRVTVADPVTRPDVVALPQAQPAPPAPVRVPGRVLPGTQAPIGVPAPPKPATPPRTGSKAPSLGRIAGVGLATGAGLLIGSRLAPGITPTAARAFSAPAGNPGAAVATNLAAQNFAAQSSGARSRGRQKCREKNCEKRRRKNRRTCREGFFRETAKKTEFVTWRRYICGTNITIMEK